MSAGPKLELVSLNTHSVEAEGALAYLEKLGRALRAARMSKNFPDRGPLTRHLDLLGEGLRHEVYDRLFVDARTGLPNMASFTRVATDLEVAHEHGLGSGSAGKRAYREQLLASPLAAVEVSDAALRRFDPVAGASAVRLDLTKLDATGTIIRVRVELTQKGKGGRRGVELDVEDKTASAREDLHATIYRHAAFDAETLFLRLGELSGVEVERVERGVIGPVCVQLADGRRFPSQLGGALGGVFDDFPLAAGQCELMLSVQSDFAARDLAEERSNDPLQRLLRERVEPSERARYEAGRAAHPFKVFKDRKFVATRALLPLAKAVCEAGGTRNLIYPVR